MATEKSVAGDAKTTNEKPQKRTKDRVIGVPWNDYISGTVVYLGLSCTNAIIHRTIFRVLGIWDPELYQKKIDIMLEYDLGWILPSILIAKYVWTFLNLYQDDLRYRVNVGVPDQYIYELVDEPKGEPIYKKSYVLMSNEGMFGKWNRAQRAAQNYSEHLVYYMTLIVFSGAFYPRMTFLWVIYGMIGRMYSGKMYIKHAPKRMGWQLPLSYYSFGFMEACIIMTMVRLAFTAWGDPFAWFDPHYQAGETSY